MNTTPRRLGALLLFLFACAPLAAGAFTATDLLNNISTFVINPIIYLLFTAAFAVFLWGLVQFASNLASEEARAEGVKHIIWGIVGMVIMLGVTGILNIINNTVQSLGGG